MRVRRLMTATRPATRDRLTAGRYPLHTIGLRFAGSGPIPTGMVYADDGPSKLVAEAREYWTLHAGRNPGLGTCAQYAGECRRAVATRQPGLPADDQRGYKRRAAFIWAALRILENWVNGGNVSDRELRGAVKLLRMYPPGEPDTPPARGAEQVRKRRRISGPYTKDRVAARLEADLPGWQDCLFEAAANVGDNVDAVAVTTAIPIRPVELAYGVRVSLEGPLLRLDGHGGKVNASRAQGQPTWSIWLDPETRLPEVRYLYEHAARGAFTVRCNTRRLHRAVQRAALTALGTAGAGVSPYVLRHALEAALRGCDPVFIALVSKHASTRSQARYGRLARGQRAPAIVEAAGSRPVRRRDPDCSPQLGARASHEASGDRHAVQPR